MNEYNYFYRNKTNQLLDVTFTLFVKISSVLQKQFCTIIISIIIRYPKPCNGNAILAYQECKQARNSYQMHRSSDANI